MSSKTDSLLKDGLQLNGLIFKITYLKFSIAVINTNNENYMFLNKVFELLL